MKKYLRSNEVEMLKNYIEELIRTNDECHETAGRYFDRAKDDNEKVCHIAEMAKYEGATLSCKIILGFIEGLLEE